MITPEEIANRRFGRSVSGYNMREVDAFLDELCAQMEQQEAERREMLQVMERLLEELEQTDTVMRDARRRMVRMESEEAAKEEQAKGGRNRQEPREEASGE